jgi:carboxylate-amine ligase
MITKAQAEWSVWKIDELTFQPSRHAALGVELELQILQACREESIANASSELMQSMLEVKTNICANVSQVKQQLVPVLQRVRNIATSMGYELALSGTHPFHRMGGSVVSPEQRYQQIQDRLAWTVHQRVVFGMHVHVGMPSGDMAIGVINGLVQYLPHLLALSANSPFWQGIDTGLASCRTALYRLLPHAGVPRYFPKWKDFRNYLRVMCQCKAIESPKDIYWDIRPRPDLGTIEFRVCDMPPSLSVMLGIVALIRSLSVSTQRLLSERPHLRRGDMRRHWIAVENKWLATRYGLGATYIRTPGGKRSPLVHDLSDLVSRLMPVARELGDDAFLAALQPLDKFETGAAWQRRVYRESGSWKALIQQLTSCLARELGESAATRDPASPSASPPRWPVDDDLVQRPLAAVEVGDAI